jgi:EAL domain-containing protein (putative c-di-GMP-specific phosphodiesterase class I)
MARIRRQEMRLGRETGGTVGQPELERSFARAIDSLFIAYQPIVRVVDRSLFGYEALFRTRETSLPNPVAVLDAAERLGRLPKLAHKIWDAAAESFATADDQALLFVNLHPADLADPGLVSEASPFAAMADRVVFEITERASMDSVDGAYESVAELRRMGFRIAIDDLGAGYAGLTSVAAIQPHFAKLDASIVRGVERSRVKQKIIGSLTSLCNELSIIVVAEGVETADERDVLVDLGCELLQGYFFGRPERTFASPAWPE